MPAIYHEGSWLGNATDPEVLVKDTVGWTGKNRAYSQTNNAVIAHIENGITYDVSWTGSATVTLKKNSASGATITSGSTSPLSFTADADYELYFGSSATVTNIMVKDSRITDPTYEPYHESVEVMYEEEIHGVNLLKVDMTSQTINGLTVTVNADKSVKITGTASTATNVIIRQVNAATENILADLEIGQKYIYSGCPIGGSNRTYAMVMNQRTVSGGNVTYKYDVGNGYEFTYDGTFTSYQMMMQIWPEAGNVNLVFKPMLRKADIEDSTYRPYNPQAIQNQLNAQGVLGAKNLLPNNATSQTINGVTFTVNDDGSVTANGTATATINAFWLYQGDFNLEPNKEYILSGCPSGGSSITYLLTISTWKSGGTYANDTGNGVTINGSDYQYKQSPSLRSGIYIVNGTTVNNITFYPMLRLASDPDDTYQPYAMTNRELTEEVFEKRTLTNSDNLNNITETGIYGITTVPANFPEATSGYCTLIVQKTNASDIRQIIIRSVNAAAYIYTRSYGGNPLAWTPWYKFTGTVVS